MLFLSNYGKLVTILFTGGKSIMSFIGHNGGKTPKYNEEFLNDFSACVLDAIHQRLSTSNEANRIEDALQECLAKGMDLEDLFDEVVEATVSANGFTFVCDTAITPRAIISFELGSSMLTLTSTMMSTFFNYTTLRQNRSLLCTLNSWGNYNMQKHLNGVFIFSIYLL